MHIDVWSDISCPYCRIGLTNLVTALRADDSAGDVTVAVRSFLLQSHLDGPVTDRSYREWFAANHRVTDAQTEENFSSVSALGDAAGLSFDWDSVIAAPTADAHRLVYLAAEIDKERGTTTGADTLALKVHLALHRAYFEEGRDVSDRSELTAMGAEFGIPAARITELYDQGLHGDVVAADFATGLEYGIKGVPAFVFDQTYLLGGVQAPETLAQAFATVREAGAEEDEP